MKSEQIFYIAIQAFITQNTIQIIGAVILIAIVTTHQYLRLYSIRSMTFKKGIAHPAWLEYTFFNKSRKRHATNSLNQNRQEGIIGIAITKTNIRIEIRHRFMSDHKVIKSLIIHVF